MLKTQFINHIQPVKIHDNKCFVSGKKLNALDKFSENTLYFIGASFRLESVGNYIPLNRNNVMFLAEAFTLCIADFVSTRFQFLCLDNIKY
jgi:hypothetical protein